MTDKDHVLSLYDVLNQSAQLLSSDLETAYLEGLAETLQNLVFEQKAQQVDGLPSQETIQTLNQLYQLIDLNAYTKEEKRKAIQLALLQAIQKDNIQSNHQITPDSIAFLIGYFMNTLSKKPIRLLDITAGTGNLLSALLNHFGDEHIESTAIEVDELLVSILAMSMQLQGHDTKIMHQDSVQPLLVDKPNMIVSDLPIGYYPHDDIAKMFKVSVSNEHTYAHHVLIEHGMQLLEENGWGIFIVPSNVFETPQGYHLLQLLTTDYYMQGFLLLPATMFKQSSARKAILLVQKMGDTATKADEVLIGEIPPLKQIEKVQDFLSKFGEWAEAFAK
ncbi:class I SAM-dependent methyltransferase [Carnobacteriaceae bacterium zg-ZUI78]|nr:class I SAM-dependent methyltransferase [Carnobacteriaceae bacterium zg-ZUI78]